MSSIKKKKIKAGYKAVKNWRPNAYVGVNIELYCQMFGLLLTF